jgi:hypothetical protein
LRELISYGDGGDEKKVYALAVWLTIMNIADGKK